MGYEAMEAQGTTVTIVQGYKYLALGYVIGIGAWISGLSLGDSAQELLGFFDNYADKTTKEATDKEDGDPDANGTAIEYDLLFHFITLLFSYLTISAIAVGGYVFDTSTSDRPTEPAHHPEKRNEDRILMNYYKKTKENMGITFQLLYI